MKKWLAYALTCLSLLTSPAAYAQFGDLFRSITGALGGGSSAQPQSGTTATIGVRGMDEAGGSVSAAPSSPDAALLDTWSARPDAARNAAQKRGLVARPVSLTGSSTAAPATNSNNASGGNQP